MSIRRRLQAFVAPLALLALPACGGNGSVPFLPLMPNADDIPTVIQANSSKTRTSGQFAVLPRAPGEKIPLNPQPVDQTPFQTPMPIPQPPPVTMTETLPAIDPYPTVATPDPDVLPPLKIEDPVPPLVRVFQAFHNNHPEQAVEHLHTFDPANQELLLQLIPAVVQSSRTNLNHPDAEEAAELAAQFQAAAAAVLKRVGVTVEKAVVCLAVDGFGVYTPVKDPADLRRGSLYSLYVELGNVPCLPETRSDGTHGYLLRLECEMQVTDEFGEVVQLVDVLGKAPSAAAAKLTSSKNEFSRSPIRDYFVAAVFRTPSRPGAYTVRFEVRDPRTGRSVSKPIPFRVQ